MNSGRYLAVCKFCAAAIIACLGFAMVGCQSPQRNCPGPNESALRLNLPPRFDSPRQTPAAAPVQGRQDTDSRMKRYQRRPSRWRVKLRAKYAIFEGFNPNGVMLSAH